MSNNPNETQQAQSPDVTHHTDVYNEGLDHNKKRIDVSTEMDTIDDGQDRNME